jgi:hypothetical protein
MFEAQFMGKRFNMTGNDAKRCYENTRLIVKKLNKLGKSKKLPTFDKAKRELERIVDEESKK